MRRKFFFLVVGSLAFILFISSGRSVYSRPEYNWTKGHILFYRYTVVNHVDSMEAETQLFRAVVKDEAISECLIEITSTGYQSTCENLNINMFNISENITVMAYHALQGIPLLFHVDRQSSRWEFINETEVKRSILTKVWDSYFELFESWAPIFEFSIEEMRDIVKGHCEEALNQSAPLFVTKLYEHRFTDFGVEQGDSIAENDRRYNYTPTICDEESILEEVQRIIRWTPEGILHEYKAQYFDNNILTHSVVLTQIKSAIPVKWIR